MSVTSLETSKNSSTDTVTKTSTSSSESEKDDEQLLCFNTTSSTSSSSESITEDGCPSGPTIESITNASVDGPVGTVNSSQQEVAKAETGSNNLAPRKDVTHQEKLTKLNSHSVQEKNISVHENLLSLKSEDECKSNNPYPNMQFTGSIGDLDILDKLKKEFEKGDIGVILSFLSKTVQEQKRVNKQLGVRIRDEDLLFRSLGEKITKHKAKLNEILEVLPKSNQKLNAEAEAEQKKSARRLSREKIKHQKSSNNHSAECSTRPKLTLKINKLFKNRTSLE